MFFKIKFKLSIILLLMLMTLFVVGSISVLFWSASSDISEETAENLFEHQKKQAQNTFESVLTSASISSILGAKSRSLAQSPEEFLSTDDLELLIETLRQHDAFYSVYAGFEDGRFFQIIAIRNHPEIIKKHDAPEGSAWIVRSILSDEKRTQKWAFLDDGLKHILTRQDFETKYNPAKRPWYRAAKEQNGVVISDPYMFFSLQQPGLTASHTLIDGSGVYGIDLTLEGLGTEISEQAFSENGGLILFDEQYRLLALSDKLGKSQVLGKLDQSQNPTVKLVNEVRDVNKLIRLSSVKTGESFFVRKEKISIYGKVFYLAAVAPVNDFTGSFQTLQNKILAVSLAVLTVFIPLAYLFAANLSQSVISLAQAADKMKGMVFDPTHLKASNIVEFDKLTTSFSDMSISLRNRTFALHRSQEKLSRIVQLGIAMSAEKETDKLMGMFLTGAKEISNADGVSLYILNESDELEFSVFQNESLNINSLNDEAVLDDQQNITLFHKDGAVNVDRLVCRVVHEQKTINIADAYADNVAYDCKGPKEFDQAHGYRSSSILTIPLIPQGGKAVGVLQLVNACDKETGDYIPFSLDMQSFVEALAAQAATSLYNRKLVEAQEKLMDALIHLIAGAIDAKSPYTGGHCERVPRLAIRLVEEASKAKTGSLGAFEFTSHDEWREFEIGAFLHDCGKVVTPEYVVDKASKLETIYNRIHEIRTRFEVLLRDAQIKSLEDRLVGVSQADAERTYEEQKAKLIDDFAFVAHCNIGGEFMEEKAIERLCDIANTVWTRNFDIKLGLAHEEALRFDGVSEAPCEEKLLDDKPYHIIERIRDLNKRYDGKGFIGEIPKHLYNQGEVYNLSVQRGTLTTEERFKINEHIMQTIVMLEELPLPDHLKRVPEYAGTHHETMMGTGYPRGLKGDDLSIPAKIMAIADIFEALTASDRPYKKAKTLSESVRILSFFKKDNHIDGELFDLFLTSGVYREYAQEFLLPEQIDEVDITPYLG